MSEFNRESSSLFPLNAVHYSKLNDSEFPIIKFGADERLIKKLNAPDQLDLNARLNELMNDDYYAKGGEKHPEEKEFKGDSEFVDLGNEAYNRRSSLKVEKTNENEELIEKKANSEKLLEESTKFVAMREAEKSSGFGGSSGLKEMYNLLEKIDDLQNRKVSDI